jgi:DNA-directed RNA polymerase specialized sigma24 family protein
MDYTRESIRRLLDQYRELLDRRARPDGEAPGVRTERWALESKIGVATDLQRAMEALERSNPRAYEVVVLHYLRGVPQADLCDRLRYRSQSGIAVMAGRGLDFLCRFLESGASDAKL